MDKPKHDNSYGRQHNAAQRYRYYNARVSHDPHFHQNRFASNWYTFQDRTKAIASIINNAMSFVNEYGTTADVLAMDTTIQLFMEWHTDPTFEEVQQFLDAKLALYLDPDYRDERKREGLPL